MRNRIITIVLIIGLTCLYLMSCKSPVGSNSLDSKQEVEGGIITLTITGKVTDTVTGLPISAAKVELRVFHYEYTWESSGLALQVEEDDSTNQKGEYSVNCDLVKNRNYTYSLGVYAEGYKSGIYLYPEEFGQIKAINGISVCTDLSDRRVAERQAKTAAEYLKRKGLESKIQVINDNSNLVQKGSSLVLCAETDTGVILGADAIGGIRKSSEEVGEEAAFKLVNELKSKPTIDRHAADMIIPFLSLINGKSVFFTSKNSEHLRTNIWLVEKILKVKFKVSRVNKLYKIEKIC